jgi:phospholipid transport system substrate-binding protein
MPHIDMRQMSKLILGNNATLFTQEQFVEFSYLFENITIRSYARYILAYKDSYSLNFDDTVMNNNTAVVYMKLKIANDQVIHTEFALYRKNSKWAIINIAIEGINYGLVYRNTYNDIIKNHGVDALLNQLREKLK